MARQTRGIAAWPRKKVELMRGRFVQPRRNDGEESEEPRLVVVKKIRDAILEETFKPGERLPEEQLGKMLNLSRTPAREALFALEKEGTVVMEPFKGATIKPLSPEEALDIAELRLSLITLAVKPAHRHLSPADFDLAYRLAKQSSRTNSAKEQFEIDRRFWDIIFGKAQRPILWEMFRPLRVTGCVAGAPSLLFTKTVLSTNSLLPFPGLPIKTPRKVTTLLRGPPPPLISRPLLGT